MKSYNDLLKQDSRITRLWSASGFSSHNDKRICIATAAFYKYKENMQQHLAHFNDAGNAASEGFCWAAVWDRNKDTKVPRSIYAGY